MRDDCPGEATLEGQCAGPAVLSVLSPDGTKTLQRIELEHAWVIAAPDGEPLVNTTTLYDDQGTINVGDFNFDGHEDFAIQATQDGPYGGPTFRVFLYSVAKSRFVLSESMSAITEDHLGMFGVDTPNQRLVAFAKSGCCFHVTEQFAVTGDEPKVVLRVTEDATALPDITETTERWVRGKWVVTTRHRRDDSAPAPSP